MRVESMSSRLDFDERRARALEGVVQYRPGAVAAGCSRRRPAADAARSHPTDGRRTRRAKPSAARGGARRRGPAAARASAGECVRRAGSRPARAASGRRRTDPSTAGRRPAPAGRARVGDSRRNREARGRRPALRRRHQRRRGAARALHRRTPVAARRGRGRHDLRARLRHLAQRAARRASSRSTASPVRRFPGRARAQAARVRPALARRCSSSTHSIADELGWLESEGPASPALVDYLAQRPPAFDYVVLFSYRYYHAWHGRGGCQRRRCSCRRRSAIRRSASSIFGPIFRGVRGHHVQLARRARDDPGGDRQRSDVPGRRRRRRIGRAGAHRPGAVPAASSRSAGRSRSTSAASTRTRAAASCSSYFQRYAAHVPARPRPGARRQARSCRCRSTTASTTSGFLDDRGQVRRAGGRPTC